MLRDHLGETNSSSVRVCMVEIRLIPVLIMKEDLGEWRLANGAGL